MAEHTLTREKILDAAEDTLRRFGPAKTTVVDVARALGVSHGSVYRHFTSKAGLRDAVVERWLHAITDELDHIVTDSSPAPARLRRWVETLVSIKQSRRASADRELFETYSSVFDEAREVVDEHLATMTRQLARIVADGVADGSFRPLEPETTARAIVLATAAFHAPGMAARWDNADPSAMLANVLDIILAGLAAR